MSYSLQVRNVLRISIVISFFHAQVLAFNDRILAQIISFDISFNLKNGKSIRLFIWRIFFATILVIVQCGVEDGTD